MSRPPSPSAYSKKYIGDARWNNLRSGCTPIQPVFPNNRLRNRVGGLLSNDEKSEKFQRTKFYGFTTWELTELDAISDRKLKTPNLENPIAPFLDIDPTYVVDPNAPDDEDAVFLKVPSTWDDGKGNSSPPEFYLPELDEHLDDDSDTGMDSGSESEKITEYWVSSNPRVRKILKPILVLASRLLETSAYTPFFNGIFFAERTVVDPSRVPDYVRYPASDYKGYEKDQLFQVHPRPFDPNDTRGIVIGNEREVINEQLMKYLKFAFLDGERDPFSGGSESPRHPCAYTAVMPEGYVPVHNIWIHLHINTFLPLLRDDLTDSERLGLMWLNASTIVHECAHAFDFLARMRDDVDRVGQLYLDQNYLPFYENDPLAELGWALEFHVGDGSIADMMGELPVLPIPPLGFWRTTIWPSEEYRALSPSLVLLYPLLTNEQDKFPIPVSLIEDMHQESFWQALTIFNAKIHDMRRTPVGVSLVVNADGIDPAAPIEFTEVELEPRLSQIENMIRMSPTQHKALAVGEELMKAAKAGERYWAGSRRQQVDTDAMLREIEGHFGKGDPANPSGNKVEDGVFYSQIIQSIRKVASAHWGKVQALIVLEKSNTPAVPLSEQRADLVAFNRGMREYIKQLDIDIGNFQKANPTAQTFNLDRDIVQGLLKGFELCRLQIWDPTGEANGPSPDREEDEHIRSILNCIANQDFATARTQSQELLRSQNTGLSWFNATLLRILIHDSMDNQEPESLPQRIEVFTDASEDLIFMRDEPKVSGGCPKEWVEELNKWIGMARTVRDRINLESLPSLDPRLRRYRDRSEMGAGIRDNRDELWCKPWLRFPPYNEDAELDRG